MTNQFQKVRRAILDHYEPGRLNLSKGLFETLDFFDHERTLNLSKNELDKFMIEGSAEEVQPIISFVEAAWNSPANGFISAVPDSDPKTEERWDWVLTRLGVNHLSEIIKNRLPAAEPMVIIEENFEHWYTPERESKNSHYWAGYERMLSRNGWDAESVSTVSEQARQVMRRIEDPTAEHYKSSRGLVVGYVQSGKTANFTAVAAKAIDAGYRMIIILAGTLENLRGQTQRRLDKELLGREAVLDGSVEGNLSSLELDQESYFTDDEEWERSWSDEGATFISHGQNLGSTGFPHVKRLTTSKLDYQGRKSTVNPLEISMPTGEAPLHLADTLADMPCMVAVVKKNSTILKKLNANIEQLTNNNSRSKDLPVLVIDDESDQASINTKAKKVENDKEERERTAVNREITKILENFPRAQYVGYTATPFANVFVDPSDPQDLYPRDYVLMLNEPPSYRGATWFHDRSDFSDNPEEATIENSQSRAFIRDLAEDDFDSFAEFEDARTKELSTCLDMFVLTGAIKKFREENNPGLSFKHHTMLVHEGVGNVIHSDGKLKLGELWRSRGYNLGSPDSEMRRLFEEDLLPVMRVDRYNGGFDVPKSYEELKPFVLKAYEEIMTDVGSEEVPILQVDSVGKDSPSFEIGKVWKVLVGGTKLSRGYTVEGLTISYFRRKAGSADTLMQTGRWFGFRKGYQDLVRLYAPPSLVEMFEAAMHDEEIFRENVKVFSKIGPDNKPSVTPIQLAPLVRQSLPELSPTAKNKMFNAYVIRSACAPHPVEFNSLPERRDKDALAENFMQVGIPLLANLNSRPFKLSYFRLEGQRSGVVKPTVGTTEAFVGTMSAEAFLSSFESMKWYGDAEGPGSYRSDVVAPRVKYLRDLLGVGKSVDVAKNRFAEVAIVLPFPARAKGPLAEKNCVTIPGISFPVPLVKRSRREGRKDTTGSDRKFTYILESIASGSSCTEPRKSDLDEFGYQIGYKSTNFPEPFDLSSPAALARGAVLLTVFDDREPSQIESMNRGNCYVPPSYERGEVGLTLTFNSPHAALKVEHGAIEWGVRFMNPDGTAPVTIDIEPDSVS